MFKITLAFVALLSSLGTIQAQYGEWIRSGRPGGSIGAHTLGAKVFQMQSGFGYRRVDAGGFGGSPILTQGNVFRLGLGERFELSAVLGFNRREEARAADISAVSGPQPPPEQSTPTRPAIRVSTTQFGFRYNLVKATDERPSVGVQTRFRFDVGQPDFLRRNVGSITMLMIGKSLTRKLGLTLNYALANDGVRPGLRSFYKINPSFRINPHLQLEVDAYGTFDAFDLNLDYGIGIFVNRDLKLDLVYAHESFGSFAGDGLEGGSDWTIGGGVSWRVDWRKADKR